ncbi:40S ribosomal protein S27 [Mortierella sp. AD010]|nr:40S ribosomal protein S27 [Mortierella sp. AD010]
MVLAYDILNPSALRQSHTHKLKKIVQTPNSFFMDVKCSACQTITSLFSHADTVISCSKCTMVLAQPTGGKARLSEGVSFRKKTS